MLLGDSNQDKKQLKTHLLELAGLSLKDGTYTREQYDADIADTLANY